MKPNWRRNMILYNYFTMHSIFLRLLMSLLLAAVLPLQGYAATRMMACGMLATGLQAAADKALPLQPPSISGPSMAPGHSHHHDEASGQPASGGRMAMSMPAHDGGQAMQGGDMSHHASNTHAKCNGCAPCCMGAVLTTAPLTIQALPTGGDGFSAPASVHASAYVGLPDRPPQPFLV